MVAHFGSRRNFGDGNCRSPIDRFMGARLGAASSSILWLLLAAAIVKLSVLLLSGPSMFPDSRKYVVYADAILDHGRAFAPVMWGAEAIPIFIVRLPGYPLILAGAKLVSPTYYAFLVVVFQSVLNGTATYLIFRVAECLLQSRRAALLVAVLYIFSMSILWDNSILPDSIYSSLFNIVVFGLLGHLIGCWQLTLGRSTGLAALWGYSILTRDSGLYFTVLPIMLTIAIAVSSEDRLTQRIAHFLVFVLVTGGMVGTYVMFNRYRTGEAFFSITGLENWLRPVFDMARYGYARPFTGDDLVSRTVRESMRGYGFQEQLNFLKSLHDQCECTPTQEQSLVLAKYLWATCQYPLAYLRVVLGNFSGLRSIVADPVWTINLFIQLGTPVGRIVPGLSLKSVMILIHDFSIAEFLVMLLVTISTTISTIAFWLFILGIPTLMLREWRTEEGINDTLALTSFLWLAFVSVSLAFSMIHVEPRHVLPVLPAALVCLVYVLQWLRSDKRRQRALRAAPKEATRQAL
jgi:hypothetical protein